jgi:hypothetical protein
MRLYKVCWKEGGEVVRTRFAGSMAQVREVKAGFITAGALKKAVEHEEVEVPTGKQPLLDFLNAELTEFDLEDGDE